VEYGTVGKMVRAGRNKINERSAGEREEGKERGPGLKRGGKIGFSTRLQEKSVGRVQR